MTLPLILTIAVSAAIIVAVAVLGAHFIRRTPAGPGRRDKVVGAALLIGLLAGVTALFIVVGISDMTGSSGGTSLLWFVLTTKR